MAMEPVLARSSSHSNTSASEDTNPQATRGSGWRTNKPKGEAGTASSCLTCSAGRGRLDNQMEVKSR